ncbi:hypothetical protein V7121_06945 [Neobacillus drentensis]|uniref:hypothetical protein n=1 Tax=Neobacillus drentensis TaxID=220684 RepID=UPI002FFD943F
MSLNNLRIHFIRRKKSVKMLVIRKNGVARVEKEKDDLQKEEEEKEFLLEYIKMQNEAMKRIFKNTLDKEETKE